MRVEDGLGEVGAQLVDLEVVDEQFVDAGVLEIFAFLNLPVHVFAARFHFESQSEVFLKKDRVNYLLHYCYAFLVRPA